MCTLHVPDLNFGSSGFLVGLGLGAASVFTAMRVLEMVPSAQVQVIALSGPMVLPMLEDQLALQSHTSLAGIFVLPVLIAAWWDKVQEVIAGFLVLTAIAVALVPMSHV